MSQSNEHSVSTGSSNDLLKLPAHLTGFFGKAALPLIDVAAALRGGSEHDLLVELAKHVRDYTAGARELSGLDFYAGLEQCTPLILLHVLPRRGQRNQYYNGIQQSYGDHTRLLLLGIDMLRERNVEWFANRTARAEQIDPHLLRATVSLYSDAKLQRDTESALWIAAALHDYGKLGGREFGLDAEDAVLLAEPILHSLCARDIRPLVDFAIRNHDLIEYVLSGETPPGFITNQLRSASAMTGCVALFLLGVIQFTGAASLGEGRLTTRKALIFDDCVSGEILADQTATSRLARLLYGERRRVGERERLQADAILAASPAADREMLANLLNLTVLRGWSLLYETANDRAHSALDAPNRCVQILSVLARLVSRSGNPEFLVLSETVSDRLCCADLPRGATENCEWLISNSRRVSLMSGTTALVI